MTIFALEQCVENGVDLNISDAESALAELNTLRAQLAEAQRDAKLERALQKAAKDLPVNWSIHVAVERNAGWVELLNADGDFEDFEDADRTLAEQVISANDAAKEKKNGS